MVKESPRNRHVLQKQLEDYAKLADNTFWDRFLEYLEDEAQDALEQLAKESYEEQKIRFWQGKYKALKLAASQEKGGFIDRTLEEIRREIDK